ncbi:MAG: sulfotransferase family 2 domain-containing protein [Pseudomonadota bacterium]
MVLTTRRYPIYYLPITKCGSTFLKSLFFALDHDGPPPSGIHDEARLLRAADLSTGFIAGSRFGFAVLRDPAERVVSFYLDKIARQGPGSFPEIRALLVREAGLRFDPSGGSERGSETGPEAELEAHRQNVMRFAVWLEANIAGQTALPVNPHWRPQARRLRRAAPLELAHLTLDGLSWQLPMLLAPAIPDIVDRMTEIAARNPTSAAMARAILTPQVAAELTRIYRRDAALVAQARAVWARRRDRGWRNGGRTPRTGSQIIRLTAAHRAPLIFLAVPKSGCTLLRNLAYLIDHGRPHPDPLAIQAERCLHSQAFSTQSHNGRAFMMLRDPVARFLSLYFDKVIGDGPHAFPWIAQRLAQQRGFSQEATLSAAQHRANCHVLMGFLERRVRSRPAGQVNPHWRPQAAFAARARRFGLRGLTLEGVGTQLPAHLGDVVPGLEAMLARLGRLNTSARPDRPADDVLVDARLERRILALYGADRSLHQRVTAAWGTNGRAPLL